MEAVLRSIHGCCVKVYHGCCIMEAGLRSIKSGDKHSHSREDYMEAAHLSQYPTYIISNPLLFFAHATTLSSGLFSV